MRRNGGILSSRDEKFRLRFEGRTEVQENGCILWTGPTNSSGYGQIGVDYVSYYAHRVAYYLYYGVWPKNFACHTCDTPLCVNGEHLFDGTAYDNSQDMVKKQRQSNNRKLPQGVIEEIRARVRSGEVQRKLAKEYKTSQATVSEINRGLYQPR